jgi:hypothetical protein
MVDDLDGGDECPARIVAVIQRRINRFRTASGVPSELTGAMLGHPERGTRFGLASR